MMTLATRSSAIPLAPPAKDAASAMKNAETHGVSGERDQRKGRAEDGERIADAALRQFDSNQEAERHADEGPTALSFSLPVTAERSPTTTLAADHITHCPWARFSTSTKAAAAKTASAVAAAGSSHSAEADP
jgi:hypothetical protein